MIRLGSIDQFGLLKPKQLAYYVTDAPRTVRLTVNAAQRSVITLWPITADGEMADDAEPILVASVLGLEDVEFFYVGPFALDVDSEIWLFSKDGDKTHIVIPDDETFTRIAERRVIDPNVRAMEERLFEAQQRMMGPLYAEIDRLRAQTNDSGARDPGGDSPAAGEPEPQPDGGNSVPSVARDDGAGKDGTESDA